VKRYLGLVVRRDCWTLSLRGKLIVLVLFALFAVTLTYGAYPFLAVNEPLRGDVMLLEGWTLPHRIAKQVAAEFTKGHYRRLLVLQDTYYGESTNATERLLQAGIPSASIETVLYPGVDRDRTYHAALVARDWLRQNEPSGNCFDVVTIGPHARRSWMLYRKAFGTTARIGVVALEDPLYDPNHWWRTSEGLREVQGEVIAYVYSRLYYL